MIAEFTNPSEDSKMSILNLFFLEHNNAQRRKPLHRLAFSPISLIFLCPKCSQNK